MTSSSPVIAFVPCRAGSVRVAHKNTRPFAGFECGLLELKLRQLSAVQGLDAIVVSSNDPVVLDYARQAQRRDPRIRPTGREDALGSSATSMGEFIKHIARMETDGVIFWTHVTLPFFTSALYSEILAAYADALAQGFDSLVTVNKIQKFLWTEAGPANYDNTVERWPRSQDLPPLFEINHGIYMLPYALMRERDDRIGNRPRLYEVPEAAAMDIDWEDQFHLVEEIALARQARGLDLV